MQDYAEGRFTPLVGEGHITILPWAYTSIVQGTWAWSSLANQLFYGQYTNTTHNDGDGLSYQIYMRAGTWTFGLLHATASNNGILELLIDAVSQGTIDKYSAVTTYNVRSTITSISIPITGMKTVVLQCNGKNGASSDHYVGFSHFAFWMTAAID